jgi:translation initiation factor 1 (eIF-1/SUI1)
MNPFETTNDTNSFETTILKDDNKFKIEIWVEHKGRKSITFIKGWNIDDTMMATKLKSIKVKNGCNGSFKNITADNNDTYKLMQLQGEHVQYMKTFFKDNDIMEDQIIIKGTVSVL